MSFTPMAQPAQHARSQLMAYHVARCPMHLPCIVPYRYRPSALNLALECLSCRLGAALSLLLLTDRCISMMMPLLCYREAPFAHLL